MQIPARGLRENAFCALMASAGCATLAWLGLYGFAWNDYELEAQPAVHALVSGHFAEFVRLAPVYGGSLVLRAPFVLSTGIWGGGELAVYRMLALPCLLASALLGTYLVMRMRALGASTLARAVALGVCVANPVTLRALEWGHAEELLAGCLCVAAVVIAAKPTPGRGRALGAGVLLGLAIASKQTALLAAGPVLAVLPARRRWLCAAAAAACAGAVFAPLIAYSAGSFADSTRAVAQTSATIFQPQQLWWFFGHHGHLVHGLFGAPKPGYRTGPAWTAAISHPLIVALGAALAVSLMVRARRRERLAGGALPLEQALLALALVLLLRCVLDTWDTAYYPLPFLLALLAWEALTQAQRPPLLALLASTLAWASFQWLPLHVSPDAESALFLAWTLPLAGWLGVRLLRGAPPASEISITARAGVRAPQEITVRALGRPVSTS